MIISDLPDELNRWYEKNCKQGDSAWSNLAKSASVSVSQLCKIAQGKVARPKYNTVKSILTALYPENNKEVVSYLVEHFPKHEFALKSIVGVERVSIDQVARELFQDEMTFRLFKFASSEAFKVETLENSFGTDMVRPRLEALIDSGIAETNGQGILKRTERHKKTATSNFADQAKEFQHAIEILASKKLIASKSDHEIDQIFNRLMAFHSSFSQEAIDEMGGEIRDFLDYLFTKYRDEKYRGNIPAFVNVATGRFDSK